MVPSIFLSDGPGLRCRHRSEQYLTGLVATFVDLREPIRGQERVLEIKDYALNRTHDPATRMAIRYILPCREVERRWNCRLFGRTGP